MRKWILVAVVPAAVAFGVGAVSLTAQGDKEKEAVVEDDRDGDAARQEESAERHFEIFGQRDVQIGVSVRDVEPDEAAAVTGARVESVRSDSPASKAGIREGDVIAEFDGERIRSARHLSRLVSESAAGRPIPAVVVRAGKRETLNVTPEERSAGWSGTFVPPKVRIERMPHLRIDPGMAERFHREFGDAWGEELVPDRGRRRLGIGIQDLTPQLAEYFGAKDGVLVTSVDDKSPAAAAGLKAGDVITAVNGAAVTSPSELQRAVRRASDKSEVSIGYVRDRKSAETKAKLPERDRPRRMTRPV